MAKILLVYSTTDGHTVKICSRIQDVLEDDIDQTTVVPVEQADALDLDDFDKIVIGASIRYGKNRPNVAEFIKQHQRVLESRPNAFFSVNVVARKPNRNTPETNPYLKRFLSQIDWKPRHLAVFAGRIDYPRYRFWDRTIIRLIMWITKGPTDPTLTVEFTDWGKVDDFGRVIKAM